MSKPWHPWTKAPLQSIIDEDGVSMLEALLHLTACIQFAQNVSQSRKFDVNQSGRLDCSSIEINCV